MQKHIPLLFLSLTLAACSSEPAPTTPDKPADTGAAPAAKSGGDAAPVAVEKPVDVKPAADAPKMGNAMSMAAAKPILIPKGTKLTVITSDALSSGKNHAGDKFAGNLSEALIIDGKTVAPKGAAVQGKVVSAEESARVKGLANMSIALTGITVNKQVVAISTAVIAQEAESTKGKDAVIIGGAAGIGTAIGAIAGGKKGAATGAAVGGGAGVGTVLATKGKEVEYPVESKLSFTTDKEFTVTP